MGKENKKIIAPSVLSADFGKIKEEIQSVEKAGADWIHVDVMDGHFVPNLTVGVDMVRAIKASTQLPIDVHLMVTNPDQFIPEFIAAGANWVSFHVEATPHAQRTLSLIKNLGANAGIALTPASPLYTLDHLFENLDMVLLMTVNPGFGGQTYIPQMTQKITHLSKKIERMNHDILIEVDGGISEKNIHEVSQAGAHVFVAGSAIFKSMDYAKTISEMKKNF